MSPDFPFSVPIPQTFDPNFQISEPQTCEPIFSTLLLKHLTLFSKLLTLLLKCVIFFSPKTFHCILQMSDLLKRVTLFSKLLVLLLKHVPPPPTSQTYDTVFQISDPSHQIFSIFFKLLAIILKYASLFLLPYSLNI